MEAKKSNKPARRQTYHHNHLHESVIEKAVQLISVRGGPTFSLREIAAALGVSHSAVYRHFADKDALLDVLTKMGFELLVAQQKRAQAEVGPNPYDQLRALCFAYISFAQEKPAYYSLMFHSKTTSSGSARSRDKHNAEALSSLIKAIKKCQENNLLIAGDPERIAAYLVLAPHGLASFHAQGHIPQFIAAQSDGPMSVTWLADLVCAPLLKVGMSPEEVSSRFFGHSETTETVSENDERDKRRV